MWQRLPLWILFEGKFWVLIVVASFGLWLDGLERGVHIHQQTRGDARPETGRKHEAGLLHLMINTGAGGQS